MKVQTVNLLCLKLVKLKIFNQNLDTVITLTQRQLWERKLKETEKCRAGKHISSPNVPYAIFGQLSATQPVEQPNVLAFSDSTKMYGIIKTTYFFKSALS